MLTLQSLNLRVKAWAQTIDKDFASTPTTPILLYQEVYRFAHELKASAGLSGDAAVKALQPAIDRCEERARIFAQDEKELSTGLNEQLLAIARSLESVEPLDFFLGKALTAGSPPPPEAPELLSRPLPWDSLSRARARSAWRHGCRFFARERRIALPQLVTEHETSITEVRALGGVSILRELAPVAAEGAALIVRTRHIVAFPAAIAANPPAEWQAL
jgi:hypothetical protein